MRIPKFQVLEKDVEAYLRTEVLKLSGKAYKFTSPANRSVPDRIVMLPGGRIYFVEVKTTKGKLTPGQERELDLIDKFGFKTFVAYGKEGVDHFIKAVRDGRI